jgi:hypothetical protein
MAVSFIFPLRVHLDYLAVPANNAHALFHHAPTFSEDMQHRERRMCLEEESAHLFSCTRTYTHNPFLILSRLETPRR